MCRLWKKTNKLIVILLILVLVGCNSQKKEIQELEEAHKYSELYTLYKNNNNVDKMSETIDSWIEYLYSTNAYDEAIYVSTKYEDSKRVKEIANNWIDYYIENEKYEKAITVSNQFSLEERRQEIIDTYTKILLNNDKYSSLQYFYTKYIEDNDVVALEYIFNNGSSVGKEYYIKNILKSLPKKEIDNQLLEKTLNNCVSLNVDKDTLRDCFTEYLDVNIIFTTKEKVTYYYSLYTSYFGSNDYYERVLKDKYISSYLDSFECDDSKYLLVEEDNVVAVVSAKELAVGYYPFVYSKDGDYFQKEFVGDFDGKEGYFYIKEKGTNKIRQIINKAVKEYGDFMKYCFVVVDNGLYVVDQIGSKIKLIYKGSNANDPLRCANANSSLILFIENGYVVEYDMYSGKSQKLFEDNGYDFVYMENYNEVYVQKGGRIWQYNKKNKTFIEIELRY